MVGLVWDSTPELEAGSAPRSNLLKEKRVHPTGPEDLPQRWPSVSPGCSNKSPQSEGYKRTVYHLMAQEATIQNKSSGASSCPVERLQRRLGSFLAFLAASFDYILARHFIPTSVSEPCLPGSILPQTFITPAKKSHL